MRNLQLCCASAIAPKSTVTSNAPTSNRDSASATVLYRPCTCPNISSELRNVIEMSYLSRSIFIRTCMHRKCQWFVISQYEKITPLHKMPKNAE